MHRMWKKVAHLVEGAFTGTLFPLVDPAPGRAPVRRSRGKPPRDSQRSRLYAAERTLRAGRKFPSVEACQEYVDSVLASSSWMRRFPRVRAIRVTDGRGRRHAGAFVNSAKIALPKWSRSRLIILHELAHHAAPRSAPAHGPEFARIYLDLVLEFLGPVTAQKLADAFVVHRVRVSPPEPAETQRTMIFAEASPAGRATFAK